MQLVDVGIDCPCPGTPHPDGDVVQLRPKLGLRAGTIIQKYIIDAYQANSTIEAADLTGLLSEAYLIHGIAAWTLVDANGALLTVSDEAIRANLLDDFALAAPIADKADGLYMEAVILPLVKRASDSSQRSQTNGRTSVSAPRKLKAPKRSRPSSTSTSQTGVTATITA